jgi:hypothetical protein
LRDLAEIMVLIGLMGQSTKFFRGTRNASRSDAAGHFIRA